jgi:hypothetical protein
MIQAHQAKEEESMTAKQRVQNLDELRPPGAQALWWD